MCRSILDLNGFLAALRSISFFAGEFMVVLFFVLSGYVLAKPFFLKGSRGLSDPVVKRHVRLALPCLVVALLGYLFMRADLFRHLQTIPITGSQVWTGSYFVHTPDIVSAIYTGAIGIFASPNLWQYNPPSWTMYYEFIGSMITFLLAFVTRNFQYRWLIYIAVVFGLWDQWFLPFVLGVILADVSCLVGLSPYKALRTPSWILFVLALLVGAMPLARDVLPPYYEWLNHLGVNGYNIARMFKMLAGAGVILSLLMNRRLQKAFEWKPLLFLGRISFSLYLLHMLILFSVGSYLFLHLQGQVSYTASVAIVTVVVVLITVPSAYVFTETVDNFAVKLSYLLPSLLKKKPSNNDTI